MTRPHLPWAALLLPIGMWAAPAHAQADRTDEDLAAYRAAEEARPGDWRPSYALGEYLLDRLERWPDALAAFDRAWRRGYTRGITRHKIGMARFRMGEPEAALAEFERAIELNGDALASGSAADPTLLRYQLAESSLWAARALHALGAPERAARATAEAHRLGADLAVSRSAWLRQAHRAFGDGDYEFAAEMYRLAFHDPGSGGIRREASARDYLDWGIDAATMLEIAEERRRLGRIAPVSTHRVLVIHYHGVQQLRAGRRRRVRATIRDDQRRAVVARLHWLRSVVESLSGGAYSLEYVAFMDARPDAQAEGEPQALGDAAILAEHLDDVDTVIRCWPIVDRIGAWVEFGRPDLRPHRDTSARRAILNIGPDHPHGIWLHEFFHVLETLAGIRPEHGYFAENRSSFPDWDGRSELEYYRWHFRSTLPRHGWENLSARIRFGRSGGAPDGG